jgi:hypothetical protein
METNDFMLQLAKQLMTERGIAEGTAMAYVKALAQLNGGKPFKNLGFLKDTAAIDAAVGGYAESTQRTLYATLVSVMGLVKGKAGYKKPFGHYYEQLAKRTADAKATEAKNEKTTKQAENWLPWETVMKRKEELAAEVVAATKEGTAKALTPAQFDTLLSWFVLSLYTDIQPRRNADYLQMYIVKKYNDKMPTTMNYYDIATGSFIFNAYKTAKKYGTQREELTEPLKAAIGMFLKYHPLWRGAAKRKPEPVKLLVDATGAPITAANAITRILNRIFGKKVGSSMLRHIFLSDKYGDALTEMKKDSAAMGHSLELQKAYVKNDTAPASQIVELSPP